jgi:thiamine kinase-like enzyme
MKNVQTNDLEVLAGIFFPHHDHLFILEKNREKPDPAKLPPGQIVLAQPDGSIPDEALFRQAAGIIYFGENTHLPGFQSRRFDFINNRDGSIRWLFPAGLDRPVFLKLYNGSGWRGRLFRTIFQLGFALGLKPCLTDGSVRIFYHKKQLLDEMLEQTPHDDFAIFTGTVGDNRKAVVALTRKQSRGWFFKLPLTDSARNLVRQEQAALQGLQEFSFKKIHNPLAVPFGKGVLLSDVRPKHFNNSTVLQPLHFEALRELQSQTLQQIPLCSLPAWQEIGMALEELKSLPILNNLRPEIVHQLIDKLWRIHDTFNPYIPVPTAISHGDFTPWNMYAASKKLHLYDWEMSERLPVLYDAIHFIFQSGILINRLPFSKINEQISALKSSSMAAGAVAGQPVDFNWLYHFYLLRNVSYYLRKYVQQQPLHEQAHWLLFTWMMALEKIPAKVRQEKG